ncbi:pentapeptide repeat-containing protein [Nocardia iowensis]|uniref:Pentapeptide repeat-containing protein n=1 Tax=Nocardia iowensis TaxID=204891 RepID=A0ABX8RYM9_NOCIO|nr:pentapeptide repeat-containing protein [Nocardia iowensis]QXN94391.1 pentapeptide repeat-containing protein [Nocardia iowensis]
MEARSATDRGAEQSFRVMPWWLVLSGFVLAIAFGLVVTWWLWNIADAGGPSRAALRIDAIRTGLTVVAGTGGAVGLLLLGRRQWLNERTQQHREHVDAITRAHQERVQAHVEAAAAADQAARDRATEIAEYDATERRVTDLFAKAVEHLGSDNAPVRLGGIYALERLAHNNERYRHATADVLCAYLRMPVRREVSDEEHVRLAIQRILTRRLRSGPDSWAGLRLDLAGAQLDGFDASGCDFDDVDFTGSTFSGVTTFDDGGFHGETRFGGAMFLGEVSLRRTQWHVPADFSGAEWQSTVSFDESVFEQHARFDRSNFGDQRISFRESTFRRTVTFDHTRLAGEATFGRACFESNASFEHVEFGSATSFRGAAFGGIAMFRRSVFTGPADFSDAQFSEDASFDRVDFVGGVSFSPVAIERTSAVRARAGAHAIRQLPTTWAEYPLDDQWVGLRPNP